MLENFDFNLKFINGDADPAWFRFYPSIYPTDGVESSAMDRRKEHMQTQSRAAAQDLATGSNKGQPDIHPFRAWKNRTGSSRTNSPVDNASTSDRDPKHRQTAGGLEDPKPRLLIKHTISEDLSNGTEADRLAKLRKIEARSRRYWFQGDQWKSAASLRAASSRSRVQPNRH